MTVLLFLQLSCKNCFIHPQSPLKFYLPLSNNTTAGKNSGFPMTTLKESFPIDSEPVNIASFRIHKEGFWALREYRSVEDQLQMPPAQLRLPLAIFMKEPNSQVVSRLLHSSWYQPAGRLAGERREGGAGSKKIKQMPGRRGPIPSPRFEVPKG